MRLGSTQESVQSANVLSNKVAASRFEACGHRHLQTQTFKRRRKLAIACARPSGKKPLASIRKANAARHRTWASSHGGRQGADGKTREKLAPSFS
jgi:hypothetical protein